MLPALFRSSISNLITTMILMKRAAVSFITRSAAVTDEIQCCQFDRVRSIKWMSLNPKRVLHAKAFSLRNHIGDRKEFPCQFDERRRFRGATRVIQFHMKFWIRCRVTCCATSALLYRFESNSSRIFPHPPLAQGRRAHHYTFCVLLSSVGILLVHLTKYFDTSSSPLNSAQKVFCTRSLFTLAVRIASM